MRVDSRSAFAESAAKALKRFPEFAVVLVRLPQQKWPAYGHTFRVALQREPITPKSWPRCNLGPSGL